MSPKEEPNDEDEEEEPSLVDDQEEERAEEPLKITKRKRKAKIVTESVGEADSGQLIVEITDLLKNARAAIADERFVDAIKCYQEASIAAGMAGDGDRERIYLSRANEILKEHPELKEEGLTIIKRRKMKAKLRKEEETFTGFLIRIISYIFIAAIFLILIYSGIFAAIILQELFEMGGSYSINTLWAISGAIEVVGLIIAYFLGTRLLRWQE